MYPTLVILNDKDLIRFGLVALQKFPYDISGSAFGDKVVSVVARQHSAARQWNCIVR